MTKLVLTLILRFKHSALHLPPLTTHEGLVICSNVCRKRLEHSLTFLNSKDDNFYTFEQFFFVENFCGM